MEKNITVDVKNLDAFLRKNKSLDLRKADLRHKPGIEACKWTGLEQEKGTLLPQLKAYQRLLRVLPDDSAVPNTANIAKALLKKGIHSALQIAYTPKKTFIEDNSKIFAGDADLAERVHRRAVACRKGVVLKYMHLSQGLEPHARAAGLNR
uniref:Uncharacterized protein n=1 Tax=Candidatus Kentrum sp. LPFa TaxID=2126335 RepID=A0A450W5F8_9GAMM|nr:MAG: hypothetical protein BECKLPF1236B_GA0070989_10324 [Candidatus Kentron sp. LPFa]